jgi:hypothetical protein
MASNPNLPRQGPIPVPPHPRIPKPKKQFPWALIAIVVAAAILAAIIYWLPQAPKAQTPPAAAQVPQQPTGSQIQLSNLKLTPAPGGGALYLDGTLINNGNTSINGITAELSFKNLRGETLETETLPVQSVATKNGQPAGTEPLTQDPIQPLQARPFRIPISHVPEGWDHHVPGMRIVKVTAAKP